MKKWMMLGLLLVSLATAAQQSPKLVVITFDGMRWKEVFRGADTSMLLPKLKGSKDSAWRMQRLWAADPELRRKKLMPFLWDTIAKKGQIYGDRDKNSNVNVTNPYWFSYPGYNEIFTGFGDTVINSNDYPANPNVTLQEFVNKQPGFKGKVAAFASWAAFNRILNEDRCGFPVNAGYEPFTDHPNAAQVAVSAMQSLLPKSFGRSERPDAVTYTLASEYMKENHPRMLQISFIETDAWGHRDAYDSYLESANACDTMIRNIWNYLQSDPFYRGQTTLLVTCDHGRGDGPTWKNHSRSIPGADQIWMAVMGPQTPARGEMENTQIYQNQFAQTMAHLLGLEFKAPHPIGKPLETVIRK